MKNNPHLCLLPQISKLTIIWSWWNKLHGEKRLIAWNRPCPFLSVASGALCYGHFLNLLLLLLLLMLLMMLFYLSMGTRIEGSSFMSCYVKLCIGFTMMIFNNLLLCDNPFNVSLQDKKKMNRHWYTIKATVAFVTQTQKGKDVKLYFIKKCKLYVTIIFNVVVLLSARFYINRLFHWLFCFQLIFCLLCLFYSSCKKFLLISSCAIMFLCGHNPRKRGEKTMLALTVVSV